MTKPIARCMQRTKAKIVSNDPQKLSTLIRCVCVPCVVVVACASMPCFNIFQFFCIRNPLSVVIQCVGTTRTPNTCSNTLVCMCLVWVVFACMSPESTTRKKREQHELVPFQEMCELNLMHFTSFFKTCFDVPLIFDCILVIFHVL